jgi:glucose/arabinose dehydrogenase
VVAGAVFVTAILVAQSAPPLPAPFATPWFRKPTRVVAMPDGHTLTVPAGFTVSVFADKLQMARFMALAPNGDVFLSEPASRTAGRSPSFAMPTRTASQKRARRSRLVSIGRSVSAFWKGYLYVGNNDSVIRFTYAPADGSAGAPEKIAELPASDAALDEDTAKRPEHSAQPDARLQPLDPQRHLQQRSDEAVRHDRLGDQRDS